MPMDYQIKRKNPYRLEHNLYKQVTYLIKRYHDLINQCNDILHNSPPPPDGMPKGNETGDPTAAKVALRLELQRQIAAIDDTISVLRCKYSDTCTGEPFDAYESFVDYGVFCYYRSRPDRDEAPSYRTWMRYKSEFVYGVSKKLHYF